MTVALLKHHFLRREAGIPKSHAHAAYLSGTKLDDGRGHTADFTPKGGILHAELWTPADAPDWAKDRGELWRRLEAREDKTTRPANAILAHKFIGALPHELSLEENIRFIKDYIREQFTRRGYAADWAIHAPDPGSDSRNYHVHIMVPLRRFENGDWAKRKDRYPRNSPALSQYIREKQEAFFSLQNRYLRKNGIEARIERRNGKWTVVKEPISSRSPYAVLDAMGGRGSAKPLSPITRPSRQTPALGSAGGGTSLGETISRAAANSAEQAGERPAAGFNLNPNKKGWPPEAVADWELWGRKDPRRFFALWPELSTGNPGPGGGL